MSHILDAIVILCNLDNNSDYDVQKYFAKNKELSQIFIDLNVPKALISIEDVTQN